MTAANRAKHIRAELKAMFPKTKFSVKSSTYSMGSDVRVRWTDGPTEGEVQNIIDCLTEDLKDCYDINLNTYYNGISLNRVISEETLEAVRQEVLTMLKAKEDPRITEISFIEKKVFWELNERSFY